MARVAHAVLFKRDRPRRIDRHIDFFGGTVSVVAGLAIAGCASLTQLSDRDGAGRAPLALGVLLARPPAQAQEASASAQAFRIEVGLRAYGLGPAVEGYVGNDGPLRLTNVRLRVDVLGTDGTAVAHAFGWVIGDVTPGGRGYFVVPVPTPGTTYRVRVLSFDIVSGGP